MSHGKAFQNFEQSYNRLLSFHQFTTEALPGYLESLKYFSQELLSGDRLLKLVRIENVNGPEPRPLASEEFHQHTGIPAGKRW